MEFIKFLYINKEVNGKYSVFLIKNDRVTGYLLNHIEINERFPPVDHILLNTNGSFRQSFPEYATWAVPFPGYDIHKVEDIPIAFHSSHNRGPKPLKLGNIDVINIVFAAVKENIPYYFDTYWRYYPVTSDCEARINSNQCRVFVQQSNLHLFRGTSFKHIVLDISNHQMQELIEKMQTTRRLLHVSNLKEPEGGISNFFNRSKTEEWVKMPVMSKKKQKEDEFESFVFAWAISLIEEVGGDYTEELVWKSIKLLISQIPKTASPLVHDPIGNITKILKDADTLISAEEIFQKCRIKGIPISLGDIRCFLKYIPDVKIHGDNYYI